MANRNDIKAWIGSYNRNFDQLCQALMWQLANRFGTVASTQPSAIAAYRVEANAGRIQPGVGPAGSFVYWEIGQFGHVGFVLENGDIFMGSRHLQEVWGINAGIASNDFYVARTGAKLLGWSWQNGGNRVPFEATVPPAPAPAPASGQLRQVRGDGVTYWEPIGELAKRIGAALAKRGRVDQPFVNDGDPGSNWRKGVQRTLKQAGFYSGIVDGKLGKNSLVGVQKYAAKFGDYTYAIDGDPQVNSWSNFALGLERP